MTLVYEAWNSTVDIDAIFKPKDDLEPTINEIMYEYGLNSQWLNDDVSLFVADKSRVEPGDADIHPR